MAKSRDQQLVVHAVATRIRGSQWAVIATVDDLEVRSTVRRLDLAVAALRRTVAVRLGRGEESIRIDVNVSLPQDLQDEINRARAAAGQAATTRAHAALLGHVTATHLKKRGLGRRDIGVLMGVSPRKASRLLAAYKLDPGQVAR